MPGAGAVHHIRRGPEHAQHTCGLKRSYSITSSARRGAMGDRQRERLDGSAQTIRAVLLANATATAFAGLRASKMTAPPRRRRCNALTSSRDGVFSAPAAPRASPRVFCVAALVSPRLSPRPRSQALRRALLPQLLPRSRRGTSASFEACCHPFPCILSSMGSWRELKVLPPESEGQVEFTPTPLPNRC